MESNRALIEAWRGGELKLVADLGPLGKSLVKGDPGGEYRPIGDGWAIRTDVPLALTLTLGVDIEFDVRDGRLQCVGIRSSETGPELTTSLLRKVEPHLRSLAREMWRLAVVRLGVHEGAVVAEEPWLHESAAGVWWGLPGRGPEVEVEFDRRRQPLTDEKLRRVAELYREAAIAGEPRTAHIAKAFPHYSPTAIRNWIRHARKRGFLGPAPQPRVAGEQRKENDG